MTGLDPLPAVTESGGLSDEIAQAAVAGLPDALSRVYEVLAPKVHGYLLGRGCEDPEGLTNEVFAQVLTRIGSVRGGASGLRTFVFSVAHARLVDEYRTRSRRPRSVEYDAARDGRVAQPPAAAVEETSWIIDLLGSLTEEQREVVLLRVLGDLSVAETAAAVGRSPSAVKNLQLRAFDSLRRRIREQEQEPVA